MQAQIFQELTPEQTDKVNPPLKWAGGKRWLLPHLSPIWQQHKRRTLVEPFVGGMAVALGLRPNKAVLNDTNIHLINFYHWLQKGLTASIQMENDKEVYYTNRTRFNEIIRSGDMLTEEAASLFYYLNRTGFNGLCRFNSRGEFNVPFGQYKSIRYTYDFTKYRDVLQKWKIQQGDFSDIKLTKGCLIYADPPYDVVFTSYSPGGFSWDDQVRLVEWLARHSGPVITSKMAATAIRSTWPRLSRSRAAS